MEFYGFFDFKTSINLIILSQPSEKKRHKNVSFSYKKSLPNEKKSQNYKFLL